MKTENNQYGLNNAAALAKQYPDTFHVPTDLEIDRIQEGDSIKVCSHGERFWCTVKFISENKFYCIVDSDTGNKTYRYMEPVIVERVNIYSIHKK